MSATCFLLQMFLLKIPGGLFGAEIEHRLLNVLQLSSHCDQCDAIHRYFNNVLVAEMIALPLPCNRRKTDFSVLLGNLVTAIVRFTPCCLAKNCGDICNTSGDCLHTVCISHCLCISWQDYHIGTVRWSFLHTCVV